MAQILLIDFVVTIATPGVKHVDAVAQHGDGWITERVCKTCGLLGNSTAVHVLEVDIGEADEQDFRFASQAVARGRLRADRRDRQSIQTTCPSGV